MSDAGADLLAACDAVVADVALFPEYDAAGNLLHTHCNASTLTLAHAKDCHDFDVLPGADPMMADQMHEVMAANASKRWKRGTGVEAAAHALGGGLAFASATAAMLGERHGHIAGVRPEATRFSGSLGKDVPMLANVGRGDPDKPLGAPNKAGVRRKPNWNCKASQAFPPAKGEPDYFLFA